MKKHFSIFLVLLFSSLTLLTSCGNPQKVEAPGRDSVETESQDQGKDKGKDGDEKAPEETSYMDWKEGDVFGVYSLGGGMASLDELKELAGKEAREDASSALKELKAGFSCWKDLEKVTSLAADAGGTVYYAIFPRWKGQKFSFYRHTGEASQDPDEGLSFEDTELSEVTSDGSVMVVRGEETDLYGNLLIQSAPPAEAGESGTASINLYHSLRDGQLTGADGVHIRLLLPPDASKASDCFYRAVGWGGSAGSSLDGAIAATSLMEWSREEMISRYDGTEIKDLFLHWLDGQDEEVRNNFHGNIGLILQDGDMILSGDEDFKGTLSDAGVSDAAAQLQGDKDAALNWETFKALMKEVFPDYETYEYEE